MTAPQELKRLLELDRLGVTYLVHRNGADEQVETVLEVTGDPVTIGRGSECTIPLGWDQAVSRLHAELVYKAAAWILSDDGLSRNGTFVNGTRVRGRHRLTDRDTIRCGASVLRFRQGTSADYGSTIANDAGAPPELTRTQRKVLIALCRPLLVEDGGGLPATNREIADELVVSTEAVRTHMRTIFQRFAISELAQNRKRVRLAQLAMDTGAVRRDDYPPD